MSFIPETAMKHAHVHDDDAPHGEGQQGHDIKAANDSKPAPTDKQLVSEDPTLGNKALDVVEQAKDAIKSHPKTAIGVGAAVVFGVAAAVAAPAVIAKVKEKDAPKKKPASKKASKAK